MQIVILGNGFDLANGLPTSYESFFEQRMEQIEDDLRPLFAKYQEMLLKEPIPVHRVGATSNGNNRLQKTQTTFDGTSYTYQSIYQELKEIMQNLLKKEISYFDLYFYIAKKDAQKFENWYDVENELKTVLSTIQPTNRTSVDILALIAQPSSYYANGRNPKRIPDFFLTFYMECASKQNAQLNDHELIKAELLAFEKTFKSYISHIYETILQNNHYRNIYYKNYRTLAGDEKTHLLNFNYTSLTNASRTSHEKLVEINVHGRCDGDIIFGIEQTACKTDAEFIFSKTYRKIENYSTPQPLPANPHGRALSQTIIFYGHSLSEADYSYFQSVFDLYDIYNETTLIFKYSIYNETERSRIAGRTFQSVTKLLQKYGATMNNTAHGKNLTHKLLLEGRLKLEEVALQDMNFELPPTLKGALN